MPTYDLATRVAAGTTVPGPVVRRHGGADDLRAARAQPDGLRLLPRDLGGKLRDQGGAQRDRRRSARPGLGAGVRAHRQPGDMVPAGGGRARRPGRAGNDTRSYAAWEYVRDLGNWTHAAADLLPAPVLETMIDFWSTTCTSRSATTAPGSTATTTTRPSAARPREVRGPARRLPLHPAMRLYLDNWQVGEEHAQREPGPRAARAAHRRPRRRATPRRWSRTRRSCSRARPSTGAPFAAYYDPTGTPPARCRSSASPTPTPPPTGSAGDRGLPALPGPPPGHRPGDRHASWPSGSSATPLRRRWSTTCAGLPRQRHRHRRHPAGAGRATRSSWPLPGRRCARRSTTWSPPSRVLGVEVQAPAGNDHVRHADWSCARSAALFSWPRPDGPRTTDADVGLGRAGCSPLRDALAAGRRLVADGGVRYRTPPPGCRRRRSASTATSTTCAGRCWAGRSTRAASRRPARPPDVGATETVITRSTRSPAGCSRGWPASCSTPPTT